MNCIFLLVLYRFSFTHFLLYRDTRYVLLMTENYAALRVLEKRFPKEHAAASVIFGSRFPKDQEFTQVSKASYFAATFFQ